MIDEEMIEKAREWQAALEGKADFIATEINTGILKYFISAALTASGLVEEVERLRKRLEVDDTYPVDGIQCRDATISLQNEVITHQQELLQEAVDVLTDLLAMERKG